MVEVFTTIMMGISNWFNKADVIASNYWSQARLFVTSKYIGNIYMVNNITYSPIHITTHYGRGIYFYVDDIFPYITNNLILIKNVIEANPSAYAGKWRVRNRFSVDQWNDQQNLFFYEYSPKTPGYIELWDPDFDFDFSRLPQEDNKAYMIISNSNIYNTTGNANETYEAELYLIKLRAMYYYEQNKLTVIIVAIVLFIAIVAVSADD
jgi:hypothetical protein